MAIAASNGAKNPDPAWFNPFAKILEKSEANDFVLDCFKKLLKQNLIPTWVMGQCDFLDKI